MRVLITGGAGFIGANLARVILQDESNEVVVIDNLSTGSLWNIHDLDVEFIEGSILDTDTLNHAASGCDGIVHLAARPSVSRSIEDPVASHLANATGTVNVLEAARLAGNAHTVLASSSSVYGANPTLPKHEGLATRPVSPYAASKLATEAYALAYQHSFDLPVLAFRFFNVFGPLQAPGHAYAAVIPAFVHAALRGGAIPVHGDGTQSRDFTYVDTVAEVITSALARGVTSVDPVNLAYGSRTNLLSIITLLEELLGQTLERDHTPIRPGDVPHSQADCTAVQTLFPDVMPTQLEIGIKSTVEWMRSTL